MAVDSTGAAAIALTANQDLLEPLAALCDRAGAAILAHYHGEGPVAHSAKADDSPVTAADLESHDILLDGLAGFGLPVLSEEDPAERAVRQQWQQYWLVDPLDGTREFLEETGEFTINIALVEDHRAMFGMISIPLTGEIYAGGPDLGAWRRTGNEWLPVKCRELESDSPLVVVCSRRHRGARLDACLDALASEGAEVQRRHAGSAIKFCHLADGSADFYPRYAPCSEWDTAAGQALLEGAGGAIVDTVGNPLRYNQRETLLNPHFLAFADPGQSLWQKVY